MGVTEFPRDWLLKYTGGNWEVTSMWAHLCKTPLLTGPCFGLCAEINPKERTASTEEPWLGACNGSCSVTLLLPW